MACDTSAHGYIPKDFVHLRLNDTLPAVQVHHKCDHVVNSLQECLQTHIGEYTMLVVITADSSSMLLLAQGCCLLRTSLCWKSGPDIKVASYVQWRVLNYFMAS